MFQIILTGSLSGYCSVIDSESLFRESKIKVNIYVILLHKDCASFENISSF